MKYNLFFYDCSSRSVVMTDMDGKELVIDCDKAESQVVFDEPEDVGILARLAREEPASYVSIAMCLGGLQDYVDVWNELNCESSTSWRNLTGVFCLGVVYWTVDFAILKLVNL